MKCQNGACDKPATKKLMCWGIDELFYCESCMIRYCDMMTVSGYLEPKVYDYEYKT